MWVLYYTRLNKLVFIIFDHFSNFVTFINILSTTFLNSSIFLIILSRKILLLTSDLFGKCLLIIQKRWLIKYNTDLPQIRVKTIGKVNLLNYVNSGVFSEVKNDKLLHILAFFLKNLKLIRCNYEIYNKRVFAIIRYFNQWNPKLEST